MNKGASAWLIVFVLLAAALGLGYEGAGNPHLFLGAAGAVFVLACGAFAYARPRDAVILAVALVLLASTKFRNRDVYSSSDVDAQVIMELALYGTIAVILTVAWLSETRARLTVTRMDLLLTAYVLYTMASTTWSSERAVTGVRSIELLILLLLAEVLVRILGPERALVALGAPLLGYVIICATAAVTIPGASGSIREYYGDTRFSWFAMHPISAAAAAGTALMFLVAEALFLPGGWARRRYRVPLWIHGLVLLVIFLATRSRGPAIALFIALTALVLRRFGRAWTVPLLGATVAVGVVAIGSGPTLPGLMRSGATSSNPVAAFLFRGQRAEDVESLNGRAELWEGALTLLREQPVLGYGYQGSRRLLLDILPWAGHAHNAVVESLLDLGALGAILIWLPVGVCFFRGVVKGGHDPGVQSWCRAVILGVVSFMVVNSMGDATFAGTPSFDVFLMMGCILVQERLPGRTLVP